MKLKFHIFVCFENRLVPNMRQTIVSTNDDPGQRRIYAVRWGGLVNDTRRKLLGAVNIS